MNYKLEISTIEEEEEAELERLQAIRNARTDEEVEAEQAEIQAASEKWCAENPDKLEF